MRITPFMIYDQLIRSLQGNIENLGQLNGQLASGKRLDKPSDDVISMMKVMDYKVSIRGNEQYRRNIDEALSQMQFTDKIIGSIAQTLRDVRNSAVRGSSGNESDQSMASLADGVAELRDYLVGLSNSRFRDRYIFSGYRTGTGAIDPATYSYLGDSNLINVTVDHGAAVPVNVPGSTALSYTLAAEKTTRLGDGSYVHYTPGSGTTVRVEIRGADNTTVLDSFEFSNVVQMTDLMSTALRNRDLPRINALLDPFQTAIDHTLDVQGDLGARMNRLDSQGKRIDAVNLNLNASLSDTEDADMARTAAEIKKTEAALEALRVSSSRVLSQSLLDFLQ
jgi:flagellar hook-associated protein 3 FlgL